MKQKIILICVLAVLSLNCSKEDNEELTTTFEGVVLDRETNEVFTDGVLNILGSEALERTYDENFPIGSDGRFRIQVTTNNVSIFQISLKSNTRGIVTNGCKGPSISQYCTLMSAGEDHVNIVVYGYD